MHSDYSIHVCQMTEPSTKACVHVFPQKRLVGGPAPSRGQAGHSLPAHKGWCPTHHGLDSQKLSSSPHLPPPLGNVPHQSWVFGGLNLRRKSLQILKLKWISKCKWISKRTWFKLGGLGVHWSQKAWRLRTAQLSAACKPCLAGKSCCHSPPMRLRVLTISSWASCVFLVLLSLISVCLTKWRIWFSSPRKSDLT